MSETAGAPGERPAGSSRIAERMEASVRGRVQGVGFRWFVRAEADRLGLQGWVRNASDGSVEVCAEGDPRALADLTRALELGPPGARVDHLEHQRGPAVGDLVGFRIRTGSHPGD